MLKVVNSIYSFFSHTYISYKNVVIDSSLFSDFFLKKLEKIRKYTNRLYASLNNHYKNKIK